MSSTWTPTHASFGLGIALQDTGWHPGSWFTLPGSTEIFTTDYWSQLSLTAESGGMDFVTFSDPLGLHRKRPSDESSTAVKLAAVTERIGLIPTLSTAQADPAHLSENLASLDRGSHGRAGWLVEVDPHDAAQTAESEATVAAVRSRWSTATAQQNLPVMYQGTSEAVMKAAATSADALFTEVVTRRDAAALLARIRETEQLFMRRRPALRVYADLMIVVEEDSGSAQRRWETLENAGGADWRPAGEVLVGDPATAADALAAYQQLGFAGVRLRPAEHLRDVQSISELLIPELRRRGIFLPLASAATAAPLDRGLRLNAIVGESLQASSPIPERTPHQHLRHPVDPPGGARPGTQERARGEARVPASAGI